MEQNGAVPRLTRLQREKLFRAGIASAVEEQALRPLLTKVLKSACELLGAEDGGVGLVQEHPRRIVMESVHNLPESELLSEWFAGQGMAGMILETNKPVIINRYGDIDPHGRPEIANNAVVGVPIFRRKRLIGFFGIGANPPRQFTQADVRVLAQFAKACAAAIENAKLHSETRASLASTKALLETTTDLSKARNLDDVVVAYLTHVAVGKRFNCSVVIYEKDDQGQNRFNVQLGSFRPGRKIDLRKSRMPHDSDLLDATLDDGETVLFSDVRTHGGVPPGLRRVQEDDGNPALALIPLMSRGERIGLVTLSLGKPHEWSMEELQPFHVTSAHLAAAIDVRQEQERLAEQQSDLALVEERKRIARDLHDSVTQSLFAMQLLSQALVAEAPDSLRPKAVRLADLCRSGLKEMRALLGELRPLDSDTVEKRDAANLLRARIERHAIEITCQAKLTIDAQEYGGASGEVEHALFRIIQEAITNASKHADCSNISVQVQSNPGSVTVTIQDDGVGFDPNQQSPAKFGIVGMQERCDSLNGSIEIRSISGKGTTVRAKLPTDSA